MMDKLESDWGKTPADLVYDDEPIQSILYGRSPEPATEASIFAPARRFLETLRNGEEWSDVNAVLSKCGRFIVEGNPLTPELFGELREIGLTLAQSEVLSATDEGQGQLSALLKYLWCFEVELQLSPMRMLVGWGYWVWCGRRGNTEEAKSVMASLYRAAGSNREPITQVASLQAERLKSEGHKEAAEILYSTLRFE